MESTMSVYIASFKITGTSPLLMNNPESMGAQPQNDVGAKKKYNAADEASLRVYRDSAGSIVFPSEAFRKAIIKACGGRKIGKLGAATIVKGSVFNIGERVVIMDPRTAKAIEKYEIDIRRAIVNKQGIMRARPMFSLWSCIVDLEIDADFIAEPGPVLQLLNIAGKIVGVGDYRAEKGGKFGRFQAELLNSTLMGQNKTAA